MATTFSSLPIIDLSPLQSPAESKDGDRARLSTQLYDVFSTTGFAYLVNLPLSFDHKAVFSLAQEFFALSEDEKMKLGKKSFQKGNQNTYRGYFPTQPELAVDNLKEGFEIGPSTQIQTTSKDNKINLSEPNVWPSSEAFPYKPDLEKFYKEMQSLSSTLLALLATSLGKEATFFDPYLKDSLSTLRLLHYPPVQLQENGTETEPKLSCTPHTDSGILTLLHQDATGGLEVRNSEGAWVPAPYVPGSIVVNIGDLMAKVSGGHFVATMHRVRAPRPKATTEDSDVKCGFGRFSVPFFFEPGENCVVKRVNDDNDSGILYGDHVRAKMKTWVEFQDDTQDDIDS